jgi:hypothetical protein
MWHQTKLELWAEHLATCDGWAAGNLKAYRIVWNGLTAYISAPRRARAKYLAAEAIAELGPSIGEAFKELRCKRAAWGDKHAQFCGEGVIPTYSKIYTDAKKRENVARKAGSGSIRGLKADRVILDDHENANCVKGESEQ